MKYTNKTRSALFIGDDVFKPGVETPASENFPKSHKLVKDLIARGELVPSSTDETETEDDTSGDGTSEDGTSSDTSTSGRRRR